MAARNLLAALSLSLLTLAGCGVTARPVTTLPATRSMPATTAASTAAVPILPTATIRASVTPAPPTTTPTPALALCSPLEGITLAELGQPDLLKNPFQTPHPGMDDGHHGDDFAFWTRGAYKTMLGLPVHSVLAGQVAAVIRNREPYGNAIMIETALQTLPADWLASIPVPAPVPTIRPLPNLLCPTDTAHYGDDTSRSLYLLYAHLNQTPALVDGQAVSCGQVIGAVGTTGKSVNPHLHLETRVGPSGATFASMSHYDTSSTSAEMSAYCTWRVSGLFQMFDPLQLLK